MGNLGSQSRGFRLALKVRDRPDVFIDSIVRLLGPKGESLRDWAKALDKEDLGKEIARVLATGVHDEWEFLFKVTSTSSQIRDKATKNSSTSSSRQPASGNDASTIPTSYGDGNIPGNLIGEKIIQTAEEITEVLSAAILTGHRKLVVLSGEPRSGKTLIMYHICREVSKVTGVSPMDFKELSGPSALFGSHQFVYMDDADVEIPSSQLEARIEKFFRSPKNALAMIVTCRDKAKISSFIKSCEGKIYVIPGLSAAELHEVLSIVRIGSHTIGTNTSKRISSLLFAIRATNIIATAMDVEIHLMYPILVDEYSRTNGKHTPEVEFTDKEIREAVRKVTGIHIEPGGKATIQKLKDEIGKRLIGQDRVIDKIAYILSTIASGMTDPTKPSGSLFLYGPTGVGKTFLGEIIADTLFGGQFHKEDMNTYSEKHSVSRLTGAPPGYIGYNDKPAILDFIDSNHRGVILLDEMEKAHSTVCDHIMELLDTGMIRDTQGNVHDARGFLIIMTSNITFGKADTIVGFDKPGTDKNIPEVEELANAGIFKKEFIGRINVVCRYEDLTNETLRTIAELMLDQMIQRLKDIGITTHKTISMIERVVASYEKQSGARSMKGFTETVIKHEIIRSYRLEEE